jgi:hypothetical protein
VDASCLCFRRAAQFAAICAVSMACTPRPMMAQPGPGQPGSESVITAQELGRVVTISLGQTFVIRRPLDVEEWEVDFATDILTLLNPPEDPPEARRSPGPEGWRFRAVGVGETDVALTEAACARPRRSARAATIRRHHSRHQMKTR